MAERRQLPPQIRRVELARRAGNKPVVRYQLTVDTGIVEGKRQQFRRRYRTEKEARAALAEIQGPVNAGSYVQPSMLTVEQACADWLQSRHKIRPTTAAGYEYVLQPVRSELGDLAVQDLTRRHIDDLIVQLRAGRLERPGGRARKAWSARSCNYMLGALSQVLAQLVAEGRLARNVAALVDRVPGKARKFETLDRRSGPNRSRRYCQRSQSACVASRSCRPAARRNRGLALGRCRSRPADGSHRQDSRRRGRSRTRPRRPQDSFSRTSAAHT